MRMFVAIDLDDAARAAVGDEQRQAARLLTSRSAVRFVDPRQVHLTLAFLGEVAAPLAEAVVQAMREPLSAVRPFQIAIGGLGVFPPHGAPRVLWMELGEGARETVALQREVAARLASLGVMLEERVFRPHLTIGRWRRARPSDRPALASAPVHPAARLLVDRVTLYESRLSSEGPTHVALAHASLS